MSNKNNQNPPTGNNNNNNNNNNNKNKSKRKQTVIHPPGNDSSQNKKRKQDGQPASSPAMGPTAPPGYGYGTPQITNPYAYAPMGTSFAGGQPGYFPPPMGNTAFATPYAQFPAQFQPQPSYTPQPMQHHGFNMQPMFNFSGSPSGASQQQVTFQGAKKHHKAKNSDKKLQSRPVEMFSSDEVVMGESKDGRVPAMQLKAQPGKTNIVVQTRPDTTWSKSHGARMHDVVNAQARHLAEMSDEPFELRTVMSRVPILADSKPDIKLLQPGSNQPVVTTKKSGKRQKPGASQAQPPAQPPAPDKAAAQGQGQGECRCINCGRQGHLVGDCVGPPNRVHGDLPACPICNTFNGPPHKDAGDTQSRGHQFDECPEIQQVYYSHSWAEHTRLTPELLQALTNGQLEMLFQNLVFRRLRRAPIRTRLVCWVDVVREVARRANSLEPLNMLGNMLPWTKDFAKEQRASKQVKPWLVYNYATKDSSQLPPSPAEQIAKTLSPDEFMARSIPGVPPQIFAPGDRARHDPDHPMDNASDFSERTTPAPTPQPTIMPMVTPAPQPTVMPTPQPPQMLFGNAPAPQSGTATPTVPPQHPAFGANFAPPQRDPGQGILANVIAASGPDDSAKTVFGKGPAASFFSSVGSDASTGTNMAARPNAAQVQASGVEGLDNIMSQPTPTTQATGVEDFDIHLGQPTSTTQATGVKDFDIHMNQTNSTTQATGVDDFDTHMNQTTSTNAQPSVPAPKNPDGKSGGTVDEDLIDYTDEEQL